MTVAAFDSLVEQLERAGVGRDAAVKHARGKYPDAVAAKEHEAAKRADVLEKDEQREVVKLFRAFGFKVYNLSQARASKQTPGLPDLWVVSHERRVGFWWETKRAGGGRFSAAQLLFRDEAAAIGIGYGCGDRVAARSKLMSLGIATVVNGTLEPVR